MPKYSARSKAMVDMLDERLVLILNDLIKIYDFTVLETFRPKDRQDQLFKEGKTKLKWPKSKHNTADNKPAKVRAVDIAPYPINWSMDNANIKNWYYMIGLFMGIASKHEVKVRPGADWNMNNDFSDNTFNDLPHFELVD